MAWILFLDDEKSPEQFDIRDTQGIRIVVCRGVSAAKYEVLERGLPCEMWLDHDLGMDDSQNTSDSIQFLKWLRWNLGDQFIPRWTIISHNPIGQERIMHFMQDWEKSFHAR